MLVEVETPNEFVGRVQGDLSSWRGLLLGSETMQGYSVIRCEVPLDQMFGYSTHLRSLSSGMASFSMEFAEYRQVPASLQLQLIAQTPKSKKYSAIALSNKLCVIALRCNTLDF